MWRQLRNRVCGGCKFRFQHAIPPYIVDFVCLERRLIVEVDGGHHTVDGDAVRTAFLESKGDRIVRFWSNEILDNLDGVFEVIEQALSEVGPSP